MLKIKTIINILSLCFIGFANAQNDNNQQKSPQTGANQTTTKNSYVTWVVKADIQNITTSLNEKVLKNEVKNKSIVIDFDNETQTLSLSIDTIKVKLSEIIERLYDKGYILLMPENKILEQKVEVITTLPTEKYKPEIDKFLNLEDSTIFTTSFIKYDSQQIHPSRRNYNQAVQIIHDFGETLKSIEINLSISKINELSKQINISTEAARSSLFEAAKLEISKSEQDLDGLIPFGKELGMLSPLQKQYYETLKDKFNDLYSKIYPD
ncbi:MAG: hypothetical protein ABI851_11370 [Saprospiraceae bacterium]